ncbi:hypothetical protein KPC_2062 [Acinetobacter stercoris]|uniref:Uncharacterized protein n=1 Tax=Acinetobacter stercoris TaxID=2126983 RepID=A0A2U3MZR2_9GAMM|nr:hypothetical protein KPC_2062 [Acinetobacter stercoris]
MQSNIQQKQVLYNILSDLPTENHNLAIYFRFNTSHVLSIIIKRGEHE